MNERIQELARLAGLKPDTGGRWLPADSFEKFVDMLVDECIEIVAHSPTHCALTTFQLGVVECTINQCTNELKKFKSGIETSLDHLRKNSIEQSIVPSEE